MNLVIFTGLKPVRLIDFYGWFTFSLPANSSDFKKVTFNQSLHIIFLIPLIKKTNKMLRTAIVILLIATFQFCFAQEIIPGINEHIKNANLDRKVEKPVDYKYVQGSCYLNETFINGRITLNTSQTYEGPIRYDIFADQIEFKNEANEIFTIQNPGIIRTVYLNSLKFTWFEDGDFENAKGFYELLVLGDYSLYKKYQILLKNPEAAGPGKYSLPAIFIPLDSKYYILDPDAGFTEITNKKDLLLPGKDVAVLEKFIKANKIKPKNEKDLIRFTRFLNGEWIYNNQIQL